MTDSEGILEKRMELDSCGEIFIFCERVTEVNGHRKENSINTNNSISYKHVLKVIITIPA
ncbi:MAG: hypothetical protein HZR80_13695 [Candidatus Heimdallarchaeota archaeon]